jgi:uncharacterized protein YkwD
MCIRPLLLTTSIWASLVSTIRAEEPPLPANLTPPVTAYARATREGDAVLLTLKLARPTTRPANGILKPTNEWRDVKLKLGAPGVLVLDTSNKPVATPRVAQLLQKDTPVLVAASGTLDSFHLLTTKETTLIVTVPPDVLSPWDAAPPDQEALAALAKTEQAVLDLANAERKKLQLPPLIAEPLLTKAARQHSANMAKQSRLEHTLDEKSVGGRLDAVGYVWIRCGENIALGPRTPAEAVSAWMESPSHRDNLLSKDFTHIGVASATASDGQHYWTMVLAAPLPK